MTQVGLMFVEIGLGLYWLALVHLFAHACLRCLQLLRLLLPAFRTGVCLSTRWRHWGESVTRVVDQVAQPLALCTATGQVLHQNPALARETVMPSGATLLDTIRRTAVTVAGTQRRAAEPMAADRAPASLTPRWRVGASLLARDEVAGDAPAVLVALQPRVEPAIALDTLHARFGLTHREVQVLEFLRQRCSNAEVSRALGVSEHTARHHTEHALAKLGLSSRRDVARWFAQLAEQMA